MRYCLRQGYGESMTLLVFYIRAKGREHSENGTPDSGTAKSFLVDMPPLQGLTIHEGPFLYQLSPSDLSTVSCSDTCYCC